MAKQTFTTGQVLTAAQMTSLQQTAMLGGAANAQTANYVLVAADAGKAVTMNNASATTITVNTGLFAAGDIVTILNIGAGNCTLTAGTATISKGSTVSLVLTQNAGGVLYFTATGAATFLPFDTGNVPDFIAGKNKLINADFNINQRAFTSATATGTYGFDRWYQSNSGGTVTSSAQTFTLGTAPVAGYEGKNYSRLVSATQSAAGDYAALTQMIEGVRTFAGQTVTVSFWAKAASGTPNVGVSMIQAFGTGGSPSAQVITSFGVQAITTSWARYSFTTAMPSISGKTIGTGNNDAIQFNIWTSVGSTISGLGYPAVGIQNNTFDIWGVQAEASAVATPFTTASGNSLQGELAMCQRYYYRIGGDHVYQLFGNGISYSTTQANLLVPLPATLRSTPSSIDSANLALFDGVNINAATLVASQYPSKGAGNLNITVAAGLTQYRPVFLLANNSTAAYIGFSAEL